ncbi:MAG: glycogen/starch/alpha-glucan phosphorylase [Caldisphaera sp.]|nr:glycogen/starch/alpha-glucan phosphorylase [Caldisphaera sp.]
MDENIYVSITPEIALDEIYGYAGGLGILEGDKFYAAASRNMKYYEITLLYKNGYVDYDFDANDNIILKPQSQPIPLEDILRPEKEFEITLKRQKINVRPWIYERGRSKVIFIEAECPKWVRGFCNRLYIENSYEEKLYKYIFLAKASAYYIKNYIGLDKIKHIDLQEAYTTLLILALPEYKNFRFTTHTPGPWGHPTFPTPILYEEFEFNYPEDFVTLTKIGLEKATITYTVSAKHEDITKKLFEDYKDKITHITNGVNLNRWVHPAIKNLIESKGIENITKEELWEAHQKAKKDLIYLLKNYKFNIDNFSERPIILYARRMTSYKRPYFIANFIEENNSNKDTLFVLGGKAHPNDKEGLELVKQFRKLSKKYDNVIFIHDYDAIKAKLLVSGTDIQTFTAFSGWEACGTSYMKSLANGVPVIGSKDGGALEVIKHEENGWLFGEDIRDLINFYTDPKAKEIDEKDYKEFSSYLEKAIKIYGSDEYKQMELNAIKISYNLVDINNVLDKLYFEKENTKEKP